MLKAKNFREWAELINKGYRNEYKKPQFQPYIYIKNINKRPSQIFPVAILGIAHFKHIPVPGKVVGKTRWQQIEIVKDIIHKHFNKCGGKSPLFGDISGYVYFSNKNKGIEFNTEGEIIDYDVQQLPEPGVILKIGSKRIYDGIPRNKPKI
jgi:hypothetical protein